MHRKNILSKREKKIALGLKLKNIPQRCIEKKKKNMRLVEIQSSKQDV